MGELKGKLLELLAPYGQEHALGFFDKLPDTEKLVLAADLQSVDFELLRRLHHEGTSEVDSTSDADFTPADVFPVARDSALEGEAQRARARGRELLDRGAVACVTVAGGQASRLGHPGPKGTFPIGPISHKPLFQLFAEKVRATAARHGRPIPWWIMTSEANDADTRAFFEQNAWFGLDPEHVGFFAQEMIPAVDRQGKLLLASRSRLFRNPNGHGGLILGLRSKGVLDEFRRRGIEQVFSFQVDNPLVSIADPLFVGLHDLQNADMSAKVVSKSSPGEKVGVVGHRRGQLTVIEYSDLPETLRDARNADGSLRFAAGNIAIHAFRMDFLERITEGSLQLPYHRAHKKVKVLSPDGTEAEIDGVKFETFVFDALAFARHSVIQEVRREEEFSPVKNREGDDSPETAQRDLIALHKQWLLDAKVAIDAPLVEISPLWALDGDDVIQRAADIGKLSGSSLYLRPS